MTITPSQTQYSWANISLNLLGTTITDVTSISYDSKTEMRNVYGAFQTPIGRSYGNITYTGSITFVLDTWRQICQAAPNGDPTLIPPMAVSVVFGNFTQGAVSEFTDILSSVQFMENPQTATQGSTGLTVQVPLLIGNVSRFN